MIDPLGALILLAAGVASVVWSVREYRRDRAWERAVDDALAVAARDAEREAAVETALHPGLVRVWRANEILRQAEAERGERP